MTAFIILLFYAAGAACGSQVENGTAEFNLTLPSEVELKNETDLPKQEALTFLRPTIIRGPPGYPPFRERPSGPPPPYRRPSVSMDRMDIGPPPRFREKFAGGRTSVPLASIPRNRIRTQNQGRPAIRLPPGRPQYNDQFSLNEYMLPSVPKRKGDLGLLSERKIRPRDRMPPLVLPPSTSITEVNDRMDSIPSNAFPNFRNPEDGQVKGRPDSLGEGYEHRPVGSNFLMTSGQEPGSLQAALKSLWIYKKKAYETLLAQTEQVLTRRRENSKFSDVEDSWDSNWNPSVTQRPRNEGFSVDYSRPEDNEEYDDLLASPALPRDEIHFAPSRNKFPDGFLRKGNSRFILPPVPGNRRDMPRPPYFSRDGQNPLGRSNLMRRPLPPTNGPLSRGLSWREDGPPFRDVRRQSPPYRGSQRRPRMQLIKRINTLPEEPPPSNSPEDLILSVPLVDEPGDLESEGVFAYYLDDDETNDINSRMDTGDDFYYVYDEYDASELETEDIEDDDEDAGAGEDDQYIEVEYVDEDDYYYEDEGDYLEGTHQPSSRMGVSNDTSLLKRQGLFGFNFFGGNRKKNKRKRVRPARPDPFPSPLQGQNVPVSNQSSSFTSVGGGKNIRVRISHPKNPRRKKIRMKIKGVVDPDRSQSGSYSAPKGASTSGASQGYAKQPPSHYGKKPSGYGKPASSGYGAHKPSSYSKPMGYNPPKSAGYGPVRGTGGIKQSLGWATLNQMSSSLPDLSKAITVMSFIAFSVFVANLGVNAIANTSLGISFGRSDAEWLMREAEVSLDGMIHDLDQLFDFDGNETSSTFDEVVALVKGVYSDLHEKTKIEMENAKEKILNFLQRDFSEDELPVGDISKGFLARKFESGQPFVHLDDICYRKLLCMSHNLTRNISSQDARNKLLPFWTFGVGWLKGGESSIPTLLENLRAELAGETGRDCVSLFPSCKDESEVDELLAEVKQELKQIKNADSRHEGELSSSFRQLSSPS